MLTSVSSVHIVNASISFYIIASSELRKNTILAFLFLFSLFNKTKQNNRLCSCHQRILYDKTVLCLRKLFNITIFTFDYY